MLKYETPELHFARCATVTYNVSQITYLVVLLCTSIFKSALLRAGRRDLAVIVRINSWDLQVDF